MSEQDLFFKFFYGIGKVVDSNGTQELAVAGAPRDADAVRTGILCRHYITVRISDIDRLLRGNRKALHDLKDGIGGGLTPYSFPLADGNIKKSVKISPAKLLHGKIRLI